MFGLLSTMMGYDESATLKKSLLDSDYTTLQLNKKYKVIYRNYEGGKLTAEWESESDTKFTEEEVNAYKAQYGEKVLGAVKYGLGINNVYPGDYGEYYNSLPIGFSRENFRKTKTRSAFLPIRRIVF